MKQLKFKIIIFIIILIVFFLILSYKNPYYVRINIKFNNIETTKIDNFWAKDLKDNILNIENVNETFIFSKPNTLNLYCKINPFKINKNETINKIQTGLNNFISSLDDDIKNNIEINFDYEFYKKYDYFLIIYSNNIAYNNLKNISDTIYDKLSDKKISSKIKTFGEQQRAAYIFYNNDDLLKYDINLSDIKNILFQNNIIQDRISKSTPDKAYSIEANGDYKNIDDIKKTPLYFKNNSFSTKFKNVFTIVDTIKSPFDYCIDFDSSKAIVLGISKKKFYPLFYLNKKLNDFINENDLNINLKLVKTSDFSKVEIYLDNNSSINFTYNLKEKLEKIFKKEDIKNIIFFVGIDLPKVSNNEDFLELDNNKLTLFCDKKYINKIYNILNKNNVNYITNNMSKTFENYSLNELYSSLKDIKKPYSNFTTYKNTKINYKIDDLSLNDYFTNKNEILNVLFANNEGLFSGYFYSCATKIPIIIKNKNPNSENAIYSKRYKTFIYLESIAQNSIKEDFHSIARKNGKYYIKIKN